MKGGTSAMKNIRFYEAEKYRTPDYEEVEDKIFKTYKTVSESDDYLGLRQLENAELAEKLMQAEGWEQGNGELLEDYLILTYEGKTYYRDSEDIGTEDDVVMVNMDDPSNPEEIFVTSIVFEAEPEYDENEPSDSMISQYPLEDILDKYFLYVNDDYIEENAGDPVNSYVEFASEDIEDIRSALEILGKHVYNFEENGYIKLRIE
jgi:hypothetical protein